MRNIIIALALVGSFQLLGQPHGSRYELVKMKEVNSAYNEGAPIISPDGKTLYFFVDSHPQNTFGKEGSQDIWTSTKDDAGVWSAPKHLPSPFNQNKLNQVFNVLPDGSIFVRGNRSKNAVGFSIVSPTGSWREIMVREFTNMNKGQFWGASISADMKHMMLYFSETSGSLSSDIYLSHLQPDGSWMKPVKMSVSTNMDDFGPFISPDQKTMYFATNSPRQGRQGLIDIYKCTRLDETWSKWGPPVNLGKPLNTAAEDDYFSMDAAGNVFVARSNSKLDGGNLDIFVLAPRAVHIMLNGTVYDNKTKQTLSNASVDVLLKDVKPVSLMSDAAGKFKTTLTETNEYSVSAGATGYQHFSGSFPIPKLNGDTTINVEIFLNPNLKTLVINGMVTNKKTGDPVDAKVVMTKRGDRSVNANPTVSGGAFSQEVAKTGMYVFAASHEGFLNATDSLNYNNIEVSPMTKEIALQPIEVGVVVRLKNIYFDFNKATLKKESFVELEKVVAFLNENPTVEIEIEGHTDNIGTDESNQKLSQDRSQSVVDYIVGKGVSGGRLQAKGFGESKPIDTNDTDAGRANNRRVEFTVLKT